MHAELSGILLSAFDSKRPKLGLGYTAGANALIEQLRASLRRLSGVALSNLGSPPTFLEALMGITICGEYLERDTERSAVVDLLMTIKCEYAYFTDNVAEMLKCAWGWKQLPGIQLSMQ
jgi:hypothetical protein